MAILLSDDIFAAGPAISGSKSRGHTWRYCPYSTQITNYNQDSKVPEGEKTFHSETAGQMYSYSHGRHLGWICPDNDCNFYLGIATTEVTQHGRTFVVTSGTCPNDEQGLATISGSVRHRTQGRTVISGTRYFEI